VALFGELDLGIGEDLTRILLEEIERPGVHVVRADLTRVTFLDSWCIGVLISAYRAAAADGRSFTVRNARGHVRRVLDVAGVLPTLSVETAS
jgi:stage II sporulation protein AA (anti-sigma F factor antagonist)